MTLPSSLLDLSLSVKLVAFPVVLRSYTVSPLGPRTHSMAPNSSDIVKPSKLQLLHVPNSIVSRQTRRKSNILSGTSPPHRSGIKRFINNADPRHYLRRDFEVEILLFRFYWGIMSRPERGIILRGKEYKSRGESFRVRSGCKR